MRHFLINVVMLSDAKFWYLSSPKTSHVVGLYQVMSHGKEKKESCESGVNVANEESEGRIRN